MAEYNVTSLYGGGSGSLATLVRTYTRGLDLADTHQGAGRIAGVLSMTDAATRLPYSYTYDGQGNAT
ncbi:hypothetical protein DB346_13835, partial [Verrucomicrobia bacterium LW23]